MDRNQKGIRLILLGGDHGLALLSFASALIGATDDVAGDGPRIVAINRAGSETIVQQFTSMRKAKKALGPMKSELNRLGADAWCEVHNVPPDFETWGQKPGS